ncbi:MAG: protein translocase subunit SecF [candidate division WOR-3 bacterium]
MIQIFKDTRVDFVGLRRVTIPLAGVLVVISIALFIFRGHQFGVDFVGGSLVQVRFVGTRRAIATEEVRAALSVLGAEGASIQRFGENDEFLIRTEKSGGFGHGRFADTVTAVLQRAFCSAELTGGTRCDSVVRRMDTTVAPRMGRELQQKALLAVIIGLLGILVYVTFRFDFKFGVCGLAALIADVVITLGVFSALSKEITIPVVAAFLTIIGYDINDKIVVSDRIREDRPKMRRETYGTIVNRALNETLSRTFLTGFSVLMVLLCLLIIGAAAIRDFALAMVVGLVVGTFTSILVMPQLVVAWEDRMPGRSLR